MKSLLLLLATTSFCSLAIAAPQIVSPALNDSPGVPGADVSGTSSSINGPAGFLDVVWGNSPSEAKHAMEKRSDITLIRETADELVYAGGTFAGLPTEIWHLKFKDGNFCEADVSFDYPVEYSQNGWAGDEISRELSASFEQKYGKNTSMDETGDHWSHTWKFAQTPGSKNSAQIKLYHSWQANVIRLTYTNLYFEKSGGAPKTASNDL